MMHLPLTSLSHAVPCHALANTLGSSMNPEGHAAGSVFKPPAQDIPPIQEGHELQRAASAEQPDMLPSGGLNTGLYIILISMHGLVRGDRMELGKDPDTGGQAS